MRKPLEGKRYGPGDAVRLMVKAGDLAGLRWFLRINEEVVDTTCEEVKRGAKADG